MSSRTCERKNVAVGQKTRPSKRKRKSDIPTEATPQDKPREDDGVRVDGEDGPKDQRRKSRRLEAHKTEEKDTLTTSAGSSARIATKRPRQVFLYGNYDRYYGYRKGANGEEDSRLSLLRPKWFKGRHCLDIGCHVGKLTIEIAARLDVRSMVGVDIDGSLIARARKNLRLRASALAPPHDTTTKISSPPSPPPPPPLPPLPLSPPPSPPPLLTLPHSPTPSIPLASPVPLAPSPPPSLPAASPPLFDPPSPLPTHGDPKVNTPPPSSFLATQEHDTSSHGVVFPHNVRFRVENFIGTDSTRGEHYDTITCFSVSKWIHLNWGDEGVKRLFRKVVALLNPGGLFLLEAQDWKSYKRKHNLTSVMRDHYHDIILKPACFDAYLTGELGLTLVVRIEQSHEQRGFRRPIWVYRRDSSAVD